MLNNHEVVLDLEKVCQELENEIHSFQLIEFIFTNVEKSKQTTLAKFDTTSLKRHLHNLLQLLRSEKNRDEISRIESELNEEIERWVLLLAQRDKSISINELRAYCEHSKPPISHQALLLLIKFYVGLPFSEPVRAKLDMLVTMLFSHKNWNGTRQLAISKDEIREKLEEFYRNWANVPSFSQFSQREIEIVLKSFHEFSSKAQQIKSLDELLSSDLHDEFLSFKSRLEENFLEPSVLAHAVEANVLIGNRYVELLIEEKKRVGEEKIHSKYALLNTERISIAVGKTFSPLEIISAEKPTEVSFVEEEEASEETEEVEKETVKKRKPEKPKENKLSFEFSFKVRNKWLVMLFLFTLALGASLYIYVEFSRSGVSNTNVEVFDVEGSEFKEYLRAARISNQVLFGVITSKWNTLSENEKRAIVEKMLSVGKQKKFNKVYLLNNNGLTVVSASEGNIEIFDR